MWAGTIRVSTSSLGDGRDRDGQLVPPGLYVCRVAVDREGGRDSGTRLIAVAY